MQKLDFKGIGNSIRKCKKLVQEIFWAYILAFSSGIGSCVEKIYILQNLGFPGLGGLGRSTCDYLL